MLITLETQVIVKELRMGIRNMVYNPGFTTHKPYTIRWLFSFCGFNIFIYKVRVNAR